MYLAREALTEIGPSTQGAACTDPGSSGSSMALSGFLESLSSDVEHHAAAAVPLEQSKTILVQVERRIVRMMVVLILGFANSSARR